MRIASYRLILPRPWIQIPLREPSEAAVQQLLDEVEATWPASMSPDERGPRRRQFQWRLEREIETARRHGGVDLFVQGALDPVGTRSSFVVSEVPTPAASVAEVTAELLLSPGTRQVTIAGHPWVRTAEEIEAAPGTEFHGVRAQKVTYQAALPDDPGHWIVAAYSTVGDGDPGSPLTRALVDLFDAIMGTWRWVEAPLPDLRVPTPDQPTDAGS